MLRRQPIAVVAAVLLAVNACPAEQNATNASSGDVLLLDRLGRLVKVPTNQMPAGFLPPPSVGLGRQMPEPITGASQPEEVGQRAREAAVGFRFLPPVPPPLSPYLASQNQFGNLAAHPGPLFPLYPFEPLVQGPKYWLSEYGLDYSLQQTLTFVGLNNTDQGESTLGYYTFRIKAAWSMYDSPASGTAGWLRAQVDEKTGINSASEHQDAQSNIGSITDPTSVWSSVNGIRVAELAWGQSFRDGQFVALAGVVNQGNYIDQNAYAQSGRGQFINSALTQSGVMPLPQYNFGANLQWQPVREFYAMAGVSAGNNKAGFAPWDQFNLDTWTALWELGYAPSDMLGLGPGIYRIEPFLTQTAGLIQESGTVTIPGTTIAVPINYSFPTNSPVQAGLSFNLQQQLGQASPFGWFGRFGFAGEKVSTDAAAQIGTGFLVQGPFHHLLLERTSDDLLGVGFVWSQPAATSKTLYYKNEYVLETFYTVQFSPTLRVQPDFQYVINPAFNSAHDHSLVFQIQLVLAW
jgi:carbohydrate-selective porin OprB